MGYTNTSVPLKDKSYRLILIPWVVWSLGCIFYFYEWLLQVSPSVMSVELMRDFTVTSQTLGVLSGIYFYSYAVMQLPCGVMMDYFGPHRLLTLATLVCALGTMAFSLTDSFFTACCARLMIGFGSAFAAVGCMKLAANWFPANRFALLTGMMITIGMLGAIGGETPLALLIDYFGWRESMFLMGIAGIFLAILILLIAKDAPETHHIVKSGSHSTIKSTDKLALWASLVELIKDKQLWLVAIYGGLMYMATPVFCGLWGVPFLMFKMQLAKAAAANYISLVFVGWAIASPFWGVFSNRIGRRKPPLYVASIGALVSCLLIIYMPMQTHWLMQSLLLLFGIFSAGFLPAFALAKELCNKRYIATSLSFMNMMNMIGIALAQPTIGLILDAMWQGELVNKVRVYPLMAYEIALAIMPIGIFISLLILPKIKETYCHSIRG